MGAMTTEQDLTFMKEAEAEALKGLSEGGIPIGSILRARREDHRPGA